MTKGLFPDAEASLSAKDICDIIKSCQRNGVSSFKFRELVLQFGDQPKRERAAVGTSPPVEDSPGDFEPDLDQMMVEDPVAYEKFLSEHMEKQEDD